MTIIKYFAPQIVNYAKQNKMLHENENENENVPDKKYIFEIDLFNITRIDIARCSTHMRSNALRCV